MFTSNLGSKVDLVQDLKEKYESGQTESSAQNKKILFWTKASAVLTAIYAGLTFWQAYLQQAPILQIS
jgi:cytochrome b subunit of formate dehydrogenase